MTSPEVAVVTIAHRRHEHLAAQHRSLALGSRRPDHYVVVSATEPPDAVHATIRAAVEPLLSVVER